MNVFKKSIFCFCLALGWLTSAPSLQATVSAGKEAWAKQDYKTALEEFANPAKQGDAEARYYLGLALINGLGIAINPTAGEQYLYQAVQAGYVPAMWEMGWQLWQTNRKEDGLTLIKLAADRGNAAARSFYAILLYNGDNVPQNRVNAYVYAAMAARQGYEEAKQNLKIMEAEMPAAELAKAKARALIVAPPK